MEDFNFSEEEIKEQLEHLGYSDVPREKLEEFKRDLEQLVKHEKSKNSSLFSSEMSPSETGSDVSSDNQYRYPLDDSNRPAEQHPYTKSTTDHSLYGKENYHDKRMPESTSVFSKPAKMSANREEEQDFSLYSERQAKDSAVRLHSDPPAEISIASTTSTDRKIVKRKVLRKKDGQAQVFDESVTESESDIDSLQERLRNLPLSVHYTRPSTAPGGGRHHYEDERVSAREYQPCYRLPEHYDGPTALIRPMTAEPHTRNIKKSDPVARYQKYNQSWSAQNAPGEKAHKGLRWNVREHMLYHDEVVHKRQHKVSHPNSYVIPSDKKRKNLRWQIRADLAQGVKPPSAFD